MSGVLTYTKVGKRLFFARPPGPVKNHFYLVIYNSPFSFLFTFGEAPPFGVFGTKTKKREVRGLGFADQTSGGKVEGGQAGISGGRGPRGGVQYSTRYAVPQRVAMTLLIMQGCAYAASMQYAPMQYRCRRGYSTSIRPLTVMDVLRFGV